MKKWRFTALSLVLATLLCSLSVSAAETSDWLAPKVKDCPDFTDVKGSWCESYVETVCEAGLMEGRSDGSFNPSGELMPEHFVTICARLYDLLTGGDGVLPEAAEGQDWYDPAYAYLAESIGYQGTYAPSSGRYLGGDGARTPEEQLNALRSNFNPGKYPAGRRSFLDLLSRTLAAAEADLPAINRITTVPDCGDPMVLSFYNAGILTGSDQYGTFQGDASLNRGQAAAILARVIDPELRLTFTPKPFDLCQDVLGVEADTVLLTVDGTAVTAAQMARSLCSAVLNQYNHMICNGPAANDLARAREDAVQTIKQDLASEALLAQKALTIDPIDPDALYPDYGIPTEGRLWKQTHAAMYERLLTFYEDRYGANSLGSSPHAMRDTPGREALDHDLLQLEESMKTDLSPDFENLDLAAVQDRLISLSFAYDL